MINTIKEKYLLYLSQNKSKYEKIKKRSNIVSVLRLVEFVAGAILVYYATLINFPTVILTIVLTIVVLLFLVKYYNKLEDKKKYLQQLININSNELEALEGKYSHFSSGKEFSNPDHPFTYDLDFFGEGFLFQFLNRTCTNLGKNKLASCLKSPFKTRDEIINQQKAIDELSSQLEWRQDFQATGNLFEDKKDDKEILNKWLNSPTLFADKFIFKFLIIFFPTINVAALFLSSFNIIPVQILFLLLLISLAIVGKYLKKINEIHNIIGKRTGLLKTYAKLLSKIENQEFESKKLVELKTSLKNNNTDACLTIDKIAKIGAALDNRSNMIAGILLNTFLLWDIIQVFRIENWKNKYKNDLENWLDVIAEFDSLSSFACFKYNTPDSVFPEISNDKFHIDAKQVGHPLIFKEQRVDNDINVSHFKQFIIITGANMAGKSTYLRTIGVNLIMAMCGSSVIAKEFVFSPVEIFTSLRTTDSLVKNESYFYAELKRLKRIIDELKAGKEVFIILDEILKGTNSKDKQTGSKALLKQLIEHDAAGFIATHDVSLGELEKEYPNNILNRRFEVEIENDQLVFDYKLKQGISQNLNATFLMKKMGITI